MDYWITPVQLFSSITGKYLRRNQPFSAEKVKNAFLGLKTSKFSLLELFDKHLKDIKSKIGKELTPNSYLRYPSQNKAW